MADTDKGGDCSGGHLWSFCLQGSVTNTEGMWMEYLPHSPHHTGDLGYSPQHHPVAVEGRVPWPPPWGFRCLWYSPNISQSKYFSVTVKPASTKGKQKRKFLKNHLWEMFAGWQGERVSKVGILKDTFMLKTSDTRVPWTYRMTAEGPKPEMSLLRQAARACYLISLPL